jgi:transposase-like protein
MPPPLSKEKVAEIIEMLKDKTRSHADIARTAEVNPVTVARIKRKFDEDVNGAISQVISVFN